MLKAFEVSDIWGDHGAEIVFAETAGQAKGWGLCEWVPEFTSKSVKRSPEFDKYAKKGVVPRQALFAAGWRFPCQHCEKRLYKDSHKVFARSLIFCSKACQRKFRTLEKKWKASIKQRKAS
jgi:hypothetical protein